MINLSRQKKLSLIFISQEARQIDVNILSQLDWVAVKEPSELSMEFERRELRKFTDKARLEFGAIRGDRRPWTWVYSEPRRLLWHGEKRAGLLLATRSISCLRRRRAVPSQSAGFLTAWFEEGQQNSNGRAESQGDGDARSWLLLLSDSPRPRTEQRHRLELAPRGVNPRRAKPDSRP